MINYSRVYVLICFKTNFLLFSQQMLKYMLFFSSLKKHAVWGWETEKHVLSSCAMLTCCEYSTNIKWHWNMNWWIMNHFRELSCQNVLEDPWNVWQIQRIPRFAFAEIYLFIWGAGRQALIFHLAHYVLLLQSNLCPNHITLTFVKQLNFLVII